MNERQNTVFLVDDDASVRRGLERLIRAAGYTVEAFASADEFLARLPLQGVGCAILDVQMPGVSGPLLHERLVELGVGIPVLFLTAHGDVLLAAVGQAMARHASETERNRVRCGIEARLARLSPRERQVMEGVIAGRLNKQIAADLVISEKTVKVHRSRVMEKMEAGSLAELVHLCQSLGITAAQPGGTRPSRLPG